MRKLLIAAILAASAFLTVGVTVLAEGVPPCC
jgi:hypothetical protein